MLLVASCYFYMYFIPVYILILFVTILIDYGAGILLEDTTDAKRKKFYLGCSIVANVGVLAIFKYYNFFLDNLNDASGWLSGNPTALRYLGIALPIGLSFHTFQAMSYTFEVYYNRQKAERHFGIYALYVMFYPQLVAGPIERPQNVLHQFHEKKYFNYTRVAEGLQMMLWGFFKKIVIADNLSGMVNHAYDDPASQSGLTLLIASYFFAFQIYCDFSGYSDIAIGAARVMGFNLMENFRTPYLAKSIKEFWSRWHISLSTWFRDYLYIPLGGNRVAKWRYIFNLFLVFMISGIWHGANWTYVIWGGLHGLYLVLAIFKDDWCNRKGLTTRLENSKWIGFTNKMFTFHLALFAWIFFRAVSVSDSFTIIKNIAHLEFSIPLLRESLLVFVGNAGNFGRFAFYMLILAAFIWADPHMDKLVKNRIAIPSRILKYSLYSLILASIVLFGFFGEVQFIYFQF